MIDTGFSGFLTLPAALVSELQLPFVTRGRATLANGSKETTEALHQAESGAGLSEYTTLEELKTAPR